ncbi:MAG: hypothetical protein NVS4B11_34460 [Ktedonobacteraceae bacterium]
MLTFALTYSNTEQLVSVHRARESEIAYWRRQYEENYEAAACAQLNALTYTSVIRF